MNFKRRLLTLDDLYSFYATHKKSSHFTSEKTGNPIVVQVNGTLHFSQNSSENDPTEGLTPVILQANHTGENINGSSISDEVATSALSSFSNRPILAYIHEVNGQPEFYKHNMHLDDNGELVYDEVPVGIITESCNAHLEYDEEKGKNYVVVNGYIFDEYSKATEILQREQECSVSVELSIRELSFDAKNKVLNIEDYYYSGVTLLGKTETGEEVKPGMVGSNIKLADFSAKNNAVFTENKVIGLLEQISKTLSKLDNIQFPKEGGKDPLKFKELLEKYGKTSEDCTFDYENMTDEELETAFSKAFDVDPESDPPADPAPEKFHKVFEISHEDIRAALYALLAPYEDTDNEWYWITNVYDTHFVYENWEGTKIYGQSYSKDENNVAFSDERWELHKELLTDSEYTELQSMRSNYTAISEQLKTYQNAELKSKKLDLTSSEAYSSISEKQEFVELAQSVIDNKNTLSFEEFEKACDEILLKYAKEGNLKFESGSGESIKSNRKPLNVKNKYKRYGNLFD